MGTTLTGTTPQDTYDSLIKVTNNGPLSSTARYLSDGLGNDSVLALSTSRVGIGTTSPDTALDVNGGSKFRGSISGFGGAEILLNAGNNSQVALSTNGTGTTEMYFDHRGTATGIWRFRDTADTRMSLTSVGLGIGTSSPTAKLNLVQTASTTVPALKIESSGTLANNDVLRVQINGVTNGFRIFQNASSEVKYTFSDGQMGIGTEAPESKLHIAGNASGSDVTLYIDNVAASTLNNSTRLKFSSDTGSSVSSGGAELNCTIVDAGNGAVDLLVKSWSGGAYTEKARFLAGGGLTFNGDTAAANALDDYEEGTWTMGVAFGGGSTGVTYANNTGTYTKIGRQVTVNGFIQLTSKGSSTGDATITGLPFVIANSASNFSAATLVFSAITFTNQFQGFGTLNTTNIKLEEITVLGAVTSISNADFANNSYIVLSFTYFV